MNDLEFGTVKIHLDELMKKRNISINKLSFRAEMQRTQLKKYCKNEVQRLDIAVLSRLCYALECDLHDLIEYIPPDELHNQQKNPMEAACLHGVKNITLILFYLWEHPFPFALTYDMVVHNIPKCEKSRNIIKDRKSLKFSAL